jgi:hypothetical protein
MTEKRQKKADFKNHRARIHRDPSIEFSSVPCWGKPQTPKSKSKGKNGTRFARVFSKAKAHGS